MTELVDRGQAVTRAASIERRLLTDRLRPPPELTVSEWADEYRVLSAEASAEPGRWYTSRAPYLRGILDAFSDPEVDSVTVMSSAQIGKTEILNNVVGFYVHQDPAPILVLQPTVQMGEAWSKDRLAPMLRDSPVLRDRFAPVKSRDSGNTILHKRFVGGHITIAGANSAASLASRPIRVVLSDEVDRFPASAGSEGDPVALAEKRTATFWNRKRGRFSTPTNKGASRIEESFHEGDQRRFHVPCPECDHSQTLKWSNVRWENRDASTACYVCESCGSMIGEEEKLSMLLEADRRQQEGEEGIGWVAAEPDRKAASFHLNALYSPWTTWAELVAEFLDAKGNPERLRVFVNTVLGETWEEEGERLEADTLLARRETFAAEAPDGVGVLTAAIDTQGDRLEFMVIGWGAGEESWLLHWEQLWGDPGQKAVWNDAAERINQRWTHESGVQLSISACLVDSGGHHTEAVYRFVRPLQRRRVHAIKGVGGEGRPLVGRPSKANKWGVRLLPVGVDTAKDAIFSRLRIEPPDDGEPRPGYLHLPDWADPELVAQITSEKVTTKYHLGRPRRTYTKTRARNEALDLLVYNYAALVVLGPSIVNNLGVWAERARGAEPDEATEDEPSRRTAARKRRGKGFATGF